MKNRRIDLHKSGERGYNLVEVMIAMGMLASVLLSIVALFLLGRNSVYSGKQMTAAVAIGNDVLEDIAGMSASAVYAAFAIDEDTAIADIDVDPDASFPGDEYEASYLRTTNDIDAVTTDPSGFLQGWKDMLVNPDDGNDTLSKASVNIVITPTEDPNTPPAFNTATVLRIRVIVRWYETLRPRQVILDTVKINR